MAGAIDGKQYDAAHLIEEDANLSIITTNSPEGVEIILDGLTYDIPQGSHKIYSNHDHTNTGQFGSQDFWGYPEKTEEEVAKMGVNAQAASIFGI